MPCLMVAVFLRDHLSASMSALLLTYCFTLDNDIQWLLMNLLYLERSLISFERCIHFTQIKSECPFQIQEDPRPDWPSIGKLEFKEYATRYRTNLPLIINNLSFTTIPGEKIGVVGRTGAGKSSVILSILRIIEPVRGQIMIDDVDITRLNLYELRKKITIIPQDSYLFTGTLRDNLDPLNAYSDHDLADALDKVGLSSSFEARGGLTMSISEGGGNLSVGEKQLVSIARAILKKSKLVLLDEATSSIDVVTEVTIQRSLKEALKDSTVIIIAHRLDTVMEADRIMVLSHRQIAEFDTPNALLSRKDSLFSEMIRKSKKN
eukprot:TRINITY_DN6101_c0_g1_i10.p1 TRINITY_DN6101_c0_g1~~TRINITY_DN6101_c0_g1_i10.p1  ORF type:complete len:320 (-),score=32.33 TRINITY_DN6101_c0_g1_i10:51-1010(-)